MRCYRSKYRSRKEFLSSNALQVWGISELQKERRAVGTNLDQENRREGHDDIHDGDEDRDVGARPRNHVGKDSVTVV